MEKYRQPARFMTVLALMFALVLGPGFIGTAKAASEDVAMFYDDLSQYGQWAEYESYGPVWRPSQVPEDWRPYTDGRWTPTNDGYVFETQEPWGWATYHYGNWMPTPNGWVWVPGRTWYPSTVEWRTTPETAPPDSSYVGWAPIPPPNYVPTQGYAPPDYYQGSPPTDSLTSSLWIFARAAEFLLGLGQTYTPAYSYMSTGILVPPAYVPVFYPQTVIVRNYYTPVYYPPEFMGVHRHSFAAYNWGPPVSYVTRHGRVNPTVFNQAINYNSVNITRIHNVVAPAAVINRHGYVRQIIPPALAQGRALPPARRVEDYRMAQANLYKPNILPPPRQVPRINAQFARFQPAAVNPGHGLPGTALPSRATMPLTQQMERQIKNLPPQHRLGPAGVRPIAPATATPQRPVPEQAAIPSRPTPGGRIKPGAVPSEPARRGEFRPGSPPAGTFTPTEGSKAGAIPPSQGPRALAPGQRRQQELEHQRIQRSAIPVQPQMQQERLQQQQVQQQQERQRKQQFQQQRQQQERQFQPQVQQRQMQERQRQIQIQQQRQQQVQQQQERQQQMQLQRQQQLQQREQQVQQLHRQQQLQQRQQQVRPQPQPRPQIQAQPRVQPQPQARPQPQPQRQEKGQSQQKKPHEQ